MHSGGNQYGNITLKDKRVVMQNIANSKVVFDLSLGTEPFPYSLTGSYSLTGLLTHWLTRHWLTHSLTYLLTYSLTSYSLTSYSLTYLLTHVFLH